MGSVCIVGLHILHTKLPNSHYESSTASSESSTFCYFFGIRFKHIFLIFQSPPAPKENSDNNKKNPKGTNWDCQTFHRWRITLLHWRHWSKKLILRALSTLNRTQEWNLNVHYRLCNNFRLLCMFYSLIIYIYWIFSMYFKSCLLVVLFLFYIQQHSFSIKKKHSPWTPWHIFPNI